MFSVLVAIVLLAIGVAAIYLLLKNMGQDGIEIAAPGSCKRGRCGVPSGPVETSEAGEAISQAVEDNPSAADNLRDHPRA